MANPMSYTIPKITVSMGGIPTIPKCYRFMAARGSHHGNLIAAGVCPGLPALSSSIDLKARTNLFGITRDDGEDYSR